MAKKSLKIGIVFEYNKGWIAGTYYILNLIEALKQIPEKPQIVFLSKEKDIKTLKEIKYPKCSFFNPYNRKRNYFEAAINKILHYFFQRDIIIKQLNNSRIDVIYPATLNPAFSLISKKIFWIPDFQHHHYPEFFTPQQIEIRNNEFSSISQEKDSLLILSSKSAYKDFQKFYPDALIKCKVIPFAVSNDDISNLLLNDTLAKYEINTPYFIVANQFWKHKNHFIVIKALEYLKRRETEMNFVIVFTGKEDIYNNNDYSKDLKQFVLENKIEKFVRFVGFIPRSEQLLLMKNSIAIIQPSLFEGWSTVVEDAKSLGVPIILSDIEVHKEQIRNNCTFFSSNDFIELSQIMSKYVSCPLCISKFDYKQEIFKFGQSFVDEITIFANDKT